MRKILSFLVLVILHHEAHTQTNSRQSGNIDTSNIRKNTPINANYDTLGRERGLSLPLSGSLSGRAKSSDTIRQNAVASETDTTPLPLPLNLTYENVKEYTIDTILVNGTKYLDKSLLVSISRLRVGSRIRVPGDEQISNAIRSLWEQGLFENVQLSVVAIKGEHISLAFDLVERPRVSRYEFHGIKKSNEEDIRKNLKGTESRVITENLLSNTQQMVKKFFTDKGFLNTQIRFIQRKDPQALNKIILDIYVKKNKKARVDHIYFDGNEEITDHKLKKFFKDTKERTFYKVFGSRKFLLSKYETDKEKFIKKYNNKGFRDARILRDTVIHNKDGNVTIDLKLYEGIKYYFGDITWAGNANPNPVYSSANLSRVLGIKKGDVYDEEKLEKRLKQSQNGDDVSSLYLDNGYLFFHADPTETRLHKDTVDLEMRIYEGAQADYNKISVKGNTRTSDKVVLRQIKTLPGNKFSKTEVIRTTRELATLGYFNEQKVNPNVNPNPNEGTVDIEYEVEEKPSDQVELSGGFGGGRIVGSLGLSFNNFSIQKLLKGHWDGLLPQGDGQKISLKASANGRQYQVYSLSFLEPWFGGHKPITFGVSASLSSLSYSYGLRYSDPNYRGATITSVSFSLGKQLKWPDDYFYLEYALNLSSYDLKNYPGFIYNTGQSYNVSLVQSISRNSLDVPIYPTSGSNIRFSVEATPPYSAFTNRNYASQNLATATKFRYTEFHKWKFDASWFIKLYGKLVLNSQARFGFVGYYDPNIGVPQLNRFLLGGDGLQGFNYLQSTEIIGLRGYANYSILPPGGNPNSGSPLYDKFTFELRHPVTASQTATIYLLGFLEGGNTWNRISDYSPFNIKRSAGVGVRIYLPIFGLLGLDYGYGFDNIPNNPSASKGQFHFTINKGLDGF